MTGSIMFYILSLFKNLAKLQGFKQISDFYKIYRLLVNAKSGGFIVHGL